MADVSASSLMADSCQFNCLPEGILNVLTVQLLCELLNAENEVYGDSYTYSDDAPSVTVSAALAETYYPVSGLTSGLVKGAPFLTLNNGVFTIGASGAGIYHVEADMSIVADKAAVIHVDVVKNGVHSDAIASDIKLGSAVDQRAMSMSGCLSLEPGDTVSLITKSSQANTTIGFRHVTFNLERISTLP